jgi:hypothetical protein
MILVVVAIAALAGPAQAQLAIAFPLIGGPGGRLVSETNTPARVQGELVVTFHGDPSVGCAAYGLCAYSGTIVVKPRSGQVESVTYRRHGRTGHAVSIILGSPEDASATWAETTRSVAGGTAGTCVDARKPLFFVQTSAFTRGGPVTIRLLEPHGTLLQTRCAGPTDGDLSALSPTRTIRLARLLHGLTVLDLSGSTPFAVHGFAGTIDSTLKLELGKPHSQSENPGFPPGVKIHRVRTVTEQLTLVRVRGGLSATVRGTGNPIVCGLLDSCGLRGTLRLTGPLRDVSAQLIATGRARGIGVFGTISWLQDVHANVSQAGSVCTDAAVTGGIAVPLGFGGRLRGFVGPLRTRCPGPSLANAQPLLGAPLSRSALGHRQFTIQVGGSGTSSDDGYEIRVRGHLSLVLRRGRITQQVSSEPAD